MAARLFSRRTPSANVADLAGEHGLTVYDAAYLELASRTQLALASRDSDLISAARRCGVELLPYLRA